MNDRARLVRFAFAPIALAVPKFPLNFRTRPFRVRRVELVAVHLLVNDRARLVDRKIPRKVFEEVPEEHRTEYRVHVVQRTENREG